MNALAAAGAGFLTAVLWFDLMFDVQVRGHAGDLPAAVLDSIGAYYRRVTTQASPMSRLIPAVMLVTVLAIVGDMTVGGGPLWIDGPALALGLSAIGLAMARTVRDAVRLGAATDPTPVRSALARSVWRDHLYCLAAMTAVAALQVAGAVLATARHHGL